MTSIIKVDEIQNKAGSTSLAANKLPDMLSGSAKVWVNFNGTGTIATRESLNVSGLTDSGTGDYSVSLTNSMSSSDYSGSAAGATSGNVGFDDAVGNTASSLSLGGFTASGSRVDTVTVVGICHGDLA